MRKETDVIQIAQMKLPPDHTREDMERKIAKLLKLPREAVSHFEVVKKSVDARKKPEIYFVYTVWVKVKNESAVVKKAKNKNVMLFRPAAYGFSGINSEEGFTGRGIRGQDADRPVIIGSGPAGLFCGLLLARHGLRPLILERGKAVEERVRDVEAFWQGGPLNPESNVQFGEGGAGTFSDGKLNTLVKDPKGRGRFVLQCFVEAGADPDILYMQKPHIGTDVLRRVVKNLREEILSLGGEIRFQSCVTDFLITKYPAKRVSDAFSRITEYPDSHAGIPGRIADARPAGATVEAKSIGVAADARLTGVIVNGEEEVQAQTVVLAIGHSARDTFETLYRKQVPMEAKAFAVGLREKTSPFS